MSELVNTNIKKTRESKLGQFDTIGLLGRIDSHQAIATMESLSDLLLSKKKNLVLDEVCGGALGNFNGKARLLQLDQLCQEVDLLIVVGGDGTLLSSARAAAKHKVPLLGVNRGSLGFLTDINPQDLDRSISSILEGDFLVDERFLLEAYIGDELKGRALNDIVLNAGTAVTMVEYELYVDGKFVYSQSADGLIISTPTGSTAYALAGGGPIMHPSLDALVLVPICPHTLSSRPMVIDGNSEICILPNHLGRKKAQISCDGQESELIERGHSLYVRKSKDSLMLLHPDTHEFYEACRSKLGWGTKLF